MRPLVVLLLVLVAAVALIFTLQRSGPSVAPLDTGPTAATVAKSGEPAAPGGVGVQEPVKDTRVATPTAAPGPGVNEALVDEQPGKNGLYGLVMNEQMQPLRGAKVELSRDARMGQEMAMMWITGASSGAKPLVTMTDESGHYRFANVIPRRDYFVVASHEGYSPTQEQLVNVGETGDFQGPNIILKTGSTVQGVVTDSGNNVVPNAVLWLDSAFFSNEGESADRLIAKSDMMGHYEFPNVYAATKQLTCSAEGYGTQTKSPVNVLGTEGEKVTVDFQLSVGQAIGGKVVASDGTGIAGAKINVYYTGNNITFRGETASLEDGAFQLLNLHPGMYILTCEAKGYRQAKHTRVSVGDMNVIIDMLSQACINGRVVDNSNNPVSAFTISVRRLAPSQLPGIGVPSEETGIKDSFTAATDGNFQLCGLDPGTYTLLASSNASAPTFSEAFSISADRPSANVLVRLSVGGSIKGRVVGPNGAPIGGAVVSSHDDTFDEDPTSGNSMFAGLVPTNTTSRKVVTTSEGMFELRFMTPEKYQLRIAHPSFAQGKLRDVMVSEGAPNDVGTIALQLGGTVKGTVLDQAGIKLSGGFVHLESESSDLVLDTRSDSDGRFAFMHVRPGNYTLSATVQGTASDNAFDAIKQMQRTQVQITVTEGGELTRDLNLTGG